MGADVRVETHGGGAVCPKCEALAVFEHPDGALKHCFACGHSALPTGEAGVQAIVWDVFRAAHEHLLDSDTGREYLVDERGLHRQVLVDSMMGIVPPELDVMQLFMEPMEAATKELETLLSAPRKPGRPSKQEQEILESARSAVEKLKAMRDQLVPFIEQHAGKFAFFYTNHAHRIVRIRAWSPGNDEAGELQIGFGAGVFNHALFAPGERANGLRELRRQRIVATSEFDLLQLQSLGARLAEAEGLRPEAGYLRAAAVGIGDVDAKVVRSLGQMPLVIRNASDPAGGTRMVEALRTELNLLVAIAPESRTLDAFLRDQAGDEERRSVLLELVRSASLVTRPFEAVQEEMDGWRSMEERGMKKFEADRGACATLVRDMSQRGQLFYDGRTAYVFDHDSKDLLPVERDNADMRAFLDRYGVAPSDGFVKHALSAIQLAAQEHGKETIVYSLSHYDVKTNRLYVFDQDRCVYRISPARIERVENGTDGVLFVKNPKWEPFEIGTPTGEGHGIAEVLLGSVRLREQALSRMEQEWLFESWLHAMFFPELFPTRPLLAMIEEKGSGKTSILRRIGQLLFGPKFQVMGMSHEPKDFDAAVTGDAFVGVDNADADVPWLDDKLAVVATGGMLKRRELYTTNRLVEFPITAFVGITSRTPHFRREDVADRLLLFYVERLQQFGAEGTLLAQLTAQRNALMTELAGDLQRVLRALEKTKHKAYPTTFRIADFAQFVLRVADAEGRLAEAEAMFDRLAEEQLAFTAQDDPVIELLEDWTAQHSGEEVTTAQLFVALRQLAGFSQRPFDFRSTKSFGQYLQSNRATLGSLFGATERTAGGRKRLWRFYSPQTMEAPTAEKANDEMELGEPTLLAELIENFRIRVDVH